MANKFVNALFGDYSKKEVKKLKKTVEKINDLADKYSAMDDKELASQTPILKERLAAGETLDDILPDAFAVCREAADRVIGLRHFDVQLIGGIVLTAVGSGILYKRYGRFAFAPIIDITHDDKKGFNEGYEVSLGVRMRI